MENYKDFLLVFYVYCKYPPTENEVGGYKFTKVKIPSP